MNGLSLITDGFLTPVITIEGTKRYVLPLHFSVKELEKLCFLIKEKGFCRFNINKLIKLYFKIKENKYNFILQDKNVYNFSIKKYEEKND